MKEYFRSGVFATCRVYEAVIDLLDDQLKWLADQRLVELSAARFRKGAPSSGPAFTLTDFDRSIEASRSSAASL